MRAAVWLAVTATVLSTFVLLFSLPLTWVRTRPRRVHYSNATYFEDAAELQLPLLPHNVSRLEALRVPMRTRFHNLTLRPFVPHDVNSADEMIDLLVRWQMLEPPATDAAFEQRFVDLNRDFRRTYAQLARDGVRNVSVTNHILRKGMDTCSLRLFVRANVLYWHRRSRLPTTHVYASDWVQKLATFLQLAKRWKGIAWMPEIDILVNVDDRMDAGCPYGFGYARQVDKAQTNFMTPFWTWLPGMNERIAELTSAAAMNSWQQRSNRLYWRGSTTGLAYGGPDVSINEWKLVTRLKLMQLAADRVSLFDVGFSEFYIDSPSCIRPEYEKYMKKAMLQRDAALFKYVVDVEGNSFSDRTRMLFAAGSLVLRQDMQWLDFTSLGIQCRRLSELASDSPNSDGAECVRVRYDLQDLPQLAEKIQTFDGAQDIIGRSRQWAKLFAAEEFAVMYMWKLTHEYKHAMQRGKHRPCRIRDGTPVYTFT